MKRLYLIVGFILLLSCVVSAENISLSYPEEVGLNEEFNMNLQLIDFPEDTYDVKIDLLSNGERVARIFNYSEWKSTIYYVNNIINNYEGKDFLLRIEKEFTVATIEVKIKDSKNKTKTFTGYTVNYNPNYINETPEENPPQDEEQNQTIENETVDEDNNQTLLEQENNTIPESSSQPKSKSEGGTYTPKTTIKSITLDPISLSGSDSKDIKSESNNEILKRNLALGGLVSFCMLFGVLFWLKANKVKKNEFR